MTTTPPSAADHHPVVRRPHRVVAVLLGAATALAGCSLPTVEAPGGGPSAQESPIASEPPDPSEAVVRSAATDLLATVEAARGPLTEAATADTGAAVRSGAGQALAALVSDAGDGSAPDTGPLFPDQTAERGSAADADDQLTRTLTAARDAGAPGSALLDLLRDPIAGDLGAWQRDAAGVLLSIEDSIQATGSLEQLEADVAELPGLGTRAVAWTRLAADTSDGPSAAAYAERAAANLEVIALTLERFLEGLDGGDDPTAEGS